MSFQEVPYLRKLVSPLSLFDLAAARVCAVHSHNEVNTGYLNHVIPRIVYDSLVEARRKFNNPLEYHDWSVSKRVTREMHNMITAWSPEDGVPAFVYEYNYLKLQYVQIDVAHIPNMIRHCLPCYNNYSRHYFANDMVEMTYIQEALYEFGDELMDALQMLNHLWCHRCITQPLFVIRESTYQDVASRWPDYMYYITRRVLQKNV